MTLQAELPFSLSRVDWLISGGNLHENMLDWVNYLQTMLRRNEKKEADNVWAKLNKIYWYEIR